MIGENSIGKFYLPEDVEGDIIVADILRGDIWEPYIIDEIPVGRLALDVGANLGHMTVAMAKRFDKVIAFEADPYLSDFCVRNAELNGLTNVQVVTAAIWSESNETISFMHVDGRYASLGSYGLDPAGQDNFMETLAIDDMNLEDVDFMKFDIQGADLHGMKGAKETILRCKPTILYEHETQLDEMFNVTADDYAEFLAEINYEVVKVVGPPNVYIEGKRSNQCNFVAKPIQ